MATSHDFEPYLTHNTQKSPFPNSSQLEITDRDATLRLIRDVRPKIIVNAAALTNVAYCETHKQEPESVNVGAARNLAEAADKNHARHLHTSPHSVVDGPYTHNT